MADPIIIDCGGSTRLKRLDSNGHGEMNKLLNVDPTTNPPRSDTESVNGPFSHIRVVTVDLNNPPQTPLDCDINPGDSFIIASDFGQSVSASISNGKQCAITLIGSANNPPVVEAKQVNQKLRYVVTNAGAINGVTAIINGRSINVPLAATPVYSTVILT